jgi:hypothetical protein
MIHLWAGAQECARLLSTVLGGQWWVGRGAITWVCGRRVAWLVDPSRLQPVHEARSVLTAVGVADPPWSLGGCARGLLRHVGEPQRYSCRAEVLRDQADWGYRHVRPGTYAAAALWDLDAAYYNLLCRLPSPCLTPHPDRLIWHPLLPDARARWLDVLLAVRNCKQLRNTLVGAMCGAGEGALRYIHGERVPSKAMCGPFRAAALLVVRTCYEVAGLQVEASECHYANTDCVLLPSGAVPKLWQGLGLPFSLRAEGPADVRALCVYRCGDYQTAPYGRGLDWQGEPMHTPLPKTLRAMQWLV